MCDKYFDKAAPYLYFVFRVLIGVIFFLHGGAKLLWNAQPPAMFSMFWFAGAIEIVAGALLVVGLFTRYVATITAIEMIFAWFIAHAPQGWNPLSNYGEPAALFFAAFLVLIAHGAGKWALDSRWKKR